MLEAHILKSFPGEHDPRTQGGPPPSAIMGMVKPLQKPPFFTWQDWNLWNPYSLLTINIITNR